MNETIVGAIIGAIFTMIGVLAEKLFATLYDKEKSTKELKRQIIENKYKLFKTLYKNYNNMYYKVLHWDYNSISIPNINLKHEMELFENTKNEYMERVKDIINILEEEYYITERLIDYKKIKIIYIELIQIHANIIEQIFMWKILNKLEDKKIVNLNKLFNDKCEEIDKMIKMLDYNFQEILYKDVFKLC